MKSIKRKYRMFIIVILTVTIIPMAVIGFTSAASSRAALLENADQSLVSSAAQVAARLDAFMVDTLDALRTEAKIVEFVKVLEMAPEERADRAVLADTNNLLTSFSQKDPVYITSYALLDLNGFVVADTSLKELGLSKADRDYFREPVRTGLPYLSPVRSSPVDGQMSLYFSAPVRNLAGNIIGVLRARYDARILQQLVLSQRSYGGDGAFAMLVSDENIMLVHTTAPELVFRSIMPLVEDQVLVLQQKQMKTRPWAVVVAQTQDLLLAPVIRQERSNMLAGITAAVVSIMVGTFIAGYLSQPIESLAKAARRMSAGDLSARAEAETRDEIGTLADSLNHMSSQLSSLVTGLEQRVADRTKALVTTTEINRHLSTILDQDLLVQEVVEQLQAAFQYYHVHIYLFDAEKRSLVIRSGTGEPGLVMLAHGHKIPRGQGVLGQAAETGIPVLVPDVMRAEGWLPNPLLPDTKSELAVPIIVSDQVVGVLDVQQNRVAGLKQEDADLLQSVANQVAVGLQNARTSAEIQRRLKREATISAIHQRIQRTASAEEALKVAVREIGRALKTGSTIRLGVQPEQDRQPVSAEAEEQDDVVEQTDLRANP
jgi:putative methionine-R-sulfoxide reductase with GAF domain